MEHHLPFMLHSDANPRSHTLEFVGPENWSPNSLDPSVLWIIECGNGMLKHMVYRHKISHTDQLKCVLIDR